MLVHIGQPDVATLVNNAWLRTLEDGIHTYDIFKPEVSKEKVGTKEFAAAIIERVGKQPQKLKAVNYSAAPPRQAAHEHAASNGSLIEKKELVGVDVFLDWNDGTPEELGERFSKLSGDGLELTMISNRGARVWPQGMGETFCTDHWRCRFMPPQADTTISHNQIIKLLQRISGAGFDFIKTENLYTFDGKPSFSGAQS